MSLARCPALSMPPLVLVVDDEALLARSISKYLEHYDYVTVVAHSGEEGLRLSEKANPDVAIIEIKLPGIDGIEVLRRIRRVSRSTEIIMVASYWASVSAAAAMSERAFACLTKPLDLNELRLLVDRAAPQQ